MNKKEKLRKRIKEARRKLSQEYNKTLFEGVDKTKLKFPIVLPFIK